MSAALIRQALLAAKETTSPELRVLLVNIAKQMGQFAWRKIEHAPRGYYVTQQRENGPDRKLFVPQEIWTYRASDGHMTKSYWIPSEERWCAYTKDPTKQPTHFMNYKPEPPGSDQ